MRRTLRMTIGVLALAGGAVPVSAAHAGASRTGAHALTAGQALTAYHAGARPARGALRPVGALLPTGSTVYEPTLGFDSSGAIYVDAECTAPSCGATQATTVIRSTDGGQRWVDVGGGAHAVDLDPFLYVDPRTRRVFHADYAEACQQLSFSDDQGATWTTTVVGCNQTDNEKIAAGPAPAGGLQPIGYPDVVYDCAVGGGQGDPSSVMRICNKSLDGGRTFIPTGLPAFFDDPTAGVGYLGIPGDCGGVSGAISVGPDGAVYVPEGLCGSPWLAVSHDEGATWTRVKVATNGMDTVWGNALTVFPVGNVPTVETLPYSDFHAAVAPDSAGNVYYTWVAPDQLPYMAVSRDDGVTWSKPMMIAPPGVRLGEFPAIIAGGPGKVAIAFVGSSNAPVAQCCLHPEIYDHATWNGYMVVTDTALAADPLFYGGAVNDLRTPLVTGECNSLDNRCKVIYDFIGVEIAPDGSPWGVFVRCWDSACQPMGEGVLGHVLEGPSLVTAQLSHGRITW